jgi:hypothetical protein
VGVSIAGRQVFQTCALPPNEGRIILATIGSTRKSRAALRKMVMVKSARTVLETVAL